MIFLKKFHLFFIFIYFYEYFSISVSIISAIIFIMLHWRGSFDFTGLEIEKFYF